MYEFFPGDYVWSQAALRAMFVGGSPGDVLRAVERLAGLEEHGADGWYDVWSGIAEVAAGKAAAALAADHRATARAAFLRASIGLQWAVAFLPFSDPRQAAGLRRSVDLFAAYGQLADPPFERLEVPYVDGPFPAWLVRPKGAERAPAVVYLPGWDSTKEQGVGGALALAERGIATLLIDGPGVGEAVADRGLVNRYDYEVPGSAAYDVLAAQPGIDPDRIGAVGSSLGGYRVARFAAFEPRLKAAVVWGAIWDFGRIWARQLARPGTALPTIVDHALQVIGAATVDEVAAKLAPWTLDGVAARISCPLYILHGADDSQIPLADAERLYREAGSTTKVLRVFTAEEGGSAHCQNDDRDLAHEAFGDWLVDVLVRGH